MKHSYAATENHSPQAPSRVLLVAQNDFKGGAGAAVRNLHRLILTSGDDYGITSTLWVMESENPLPRTIVGLPGRRWARWWIGVLTFLSRAFCKVLLERDGQIRSLAWVRTGVGSAINNMDIDVVLFGWLGDATISIEELGDVQARKFLVLHDEWAIGGPAHFLALQADNSGPWFLATKLEASLSQWMRRRKDVSWSAELGVVSPTRALAEKVRASSLFCAADVKVVPNCIDWEFWRPGQVDKDDFPFPLDDSLPMVVFVAAGGIRDRRKGYDFLLDSLAQQPVGTNIQLIVVGSTLDAEHFPWGHTVPVGRLDHIAMRSVYRMAQVVALPSTQEIQPMVALEALSCGTSVVSIAGFDIDGALARNGARFVSADLDSEVFGSLILQETRAESPLAPKVRNSAPDVLNAVGTHFERLSFLKKH